LLHFKGYNFLAKDGIYQGTIKERKTPYTNDIGDVEVSYQKLAPEQLSIIAMADSNGRLLPYKTEAGDELLMAHCRSASASEMFREAQNFNNVLTWGLRITGFGFMTCGLASLASPIVAVLDCVPCSGGLFAGLNLES